MAVYAISDLHLAFSIDKPMDVFGDRWANYMEKINTEWRKTVSEEDYVIVPGDISWATYLEQAVEDFRFIDSLPGRKIISKGNHDYWWTTMSKLERFVSEHGFSSISFMHNNSFDLEKIIVCGTRGWKCPGDEDFGADDRRIFDREVQRLELSLKSIPRTEGKKIVVALHYPPFNSQKEPSDLVSVMQQYGVRLCIYGHLHGDAFRGAVTGIAGGIDFKLVSADYLYFKPLAVT